MLKTHLSACPDDFWHFPQLFGASAPPPWKKHALPGFTSSWPPLVGILGWLVSLLCCFANDHPSDQSPSELAISPDTVDNSQKSPNSSSPANPNVEQDQCLHGQGPHLFLPVFSPKI